MYATASLPAHPTAELTPTASEHAAFGYSFQPSLEDSAILPLALLSPTSPDRSNGALTTPSALGDEQCNTLSLQGDG